MVAIQSVLAVFLPSAQTFIIITSQPSERSTSNLERRDDWVKPARANMSRFVKDEHHQIRMYIMDTYTLYFPVIIKHTVHTSFIRSQFTSVCNKNHLKLQNSKILYLHGGALNSSQDVKSGVRSGVVLCSCERSSSSRCPGFAQAVAWMAGDPTRVWTTLAHLYENNTH